MPATYMLPRLSTSTSRIPSPALPPKKVEKVRLYDLPTAMPANSRVVTNTIKFFMMHLTILVSSKWRIVHRIVSEQFYQTAGCFVQKSSKADATQNMCSGS